jgi:hypothetical protein
VVPEDQHQQVLAAVEDLAQVAEVLLEEAVVVVRTESL